METSEVEYRTERIDHLGIVAGVCKQIKLTAWQEIGWVTRVSETVGEAKAILQAVATATMEEVGDGYRICPLCNTYGDIRQHWLLAYSQQAYERGSKQLDKRIAKAKEAAEQAWHTLQRRTFQCQADAEAAALQLAQKLPWHRPQAR